MEILLKYQVEQVRAGRVEYGTVEQVTAKRKSFCRCCGSEIAKGEHALKFFWDFLGNGSWTAGIAMMHFTCTPVSDEVRTRANLEAAAVRLEKLAEKTQEKAEGASRKATVRRLEREAEGYSKRAEQARTELAKLEG
jgi:hypothetical protein